MDRPSPTLMTKRSNVSLTSPVPSRNATHHSPLAFLINRQTLKKDAAVVVVECSNWEDSSTNESFTKSEPAPCEPATTQLVSTKRLSAPNVSALEKVFEGVRLTSTRARVLLTELPSPYQALSTKGRFNHYYVEPLYNWRGKNHRLLLTHSLSSVDIQEKDGGIRHTVNGASHNYAGFYRMTEESEELQRLCLDELPFADVYAVPRLETAVRSAVAQLFSSGFCLTTSTGYGSNLVLFDALLDKSWLLILDEKCHNSMHTASHLAHAGGVQKFRHNNVEELEEILRGMAGDFANVLVAIEGFYSMDGTTPPLDQLHRLKQKYHFTLCCDEAHSFLSIGKTGRGCVELWNDDHPNSPLPLDMIDIRSATLSKAIAGIGGIIFGDQKYETTVSDYLHQREKQGCESLSASCMVQTLYVLGQPTRLKRHLRRLRHISIFCREELRRFGIHVYGDTAIPVLPVHTGRPSVAAKFSYVLRQLGLLAVPVTAPAVDFWKSRVRICLSADHTDEEVDKLIRCVIQAAQRVGICNKVKLQQRQYSYDLMHSGIEEDGEEERETREIQNQEAALSNQFIRQLILEDAQNLKKIQSPSRLTFDYNCGVAGLESGHASRALYGLGSGGSRWVIGTFPSHLQVEKLIAQVTKTEAAITYPDSGIGLLSTVAALCRPLIGYTEHYLLLPRQASTFVFDGIRVANPKGTPNVMQYESLEELFLLVQAISSKNHDKYLTVYIDTVVNGVLLDFDSIVAQLTQRKASSTGMTLLLNDFDGLGHHGINRQGIGSTCRQHSNISEAARKLQTRILVCGSFFRAFGLSGGYVAGDESLIQELRYTSRSYMFSSSPQPFVMDMIRSALEIRLMT